MIYEVWYSIYDLEHRLEKLEKSKNFVHSWQKRLIRCLSSQWQEHRLEKLKNSKNQWICSWKKKTQIEEIGEIKKSLIYLIL